eukprot:g5574.t1
MGMSMRVERSTVEQVKARLEMHKKKGTKRKDLSEETAATETLQLEYEETSKSEETSEAEDESQEEQDGGGLDSEAAALMGFSGFGSSKP